MKTLYCYSTNKLGPLKPRDLAWLWGEKNTIRVNEHTFPKYKTYYTGLLRRQWNKHKNPCLQSCAGLEVLATWIIKTDVSTACKAASWYQFCTHKEPSTAEAVIPYLWTRTSLLLETWLGLLNRHIMGLIGVGVEWGAWVGTHVRLEEKETGIIYLRSVEVLLLMRWVGKLL